MIGPSDLNRLTRASVPPASEDFLRYARLELGASDGGLTAASPSRAPRTNGLRAWLAAHVARPALARAVLRPGLAAAHFDGRMPSDPREDRVILPVVHSAALVASGSLVMTARMHGPCSRDEIVCEH